MRQPQSFGDEFAAPELVPSWTRPKRPKKDNNLYETDLIEVDWEKLFRIHYKGYESQFDEWRPPMTVMENIFLLFDKKNHKF